MSAQSSDTLNGIIQLNDANFADINVSDLLQDAPVVAAMAAVPASQGGTLHKYLKETREAGAQFRALQTGILNAASQDTPVEVTCKYLDGTFYRDVAVADSYKGGRAAYMARETKRALKALFVALEKQILTGAALGGDAGGFSGFGEQAGVNAPSDAMVVNAEGISTGCRSVWAVRTTVDDVAIVAGNDGQIKFDFDPEQLVPVFSVANATPANVRSYSALMVTLGAWFGVQYGSAYSLGRIANLKAGNSGTVLTDDKIAKLLAKFPASRMPNALIMSRTSLAELRESRTATNPTGSPAPFPSEAFGVPIIVSDHLNDNETAIAD